MQVYDAMLAVDTDGNIRDFVHFTQINNSYCVSTTAPFHSLY
jgi:hypothetical protein